MEHAEKLVTQNVVKIARTIVPRHVKVVVRGLVKTGVLAIAQHIVTKNAQIIV